MVAKEFFTSAEFAKLPGVEKTEYTVRQWCRLGRINAQKATSGRGEWGEWRISKDEYKRYLDDGLRPGG